MSTPDLQRFEKLQVEFTRDIIAAVKAEVGGVDLPDEEKRRLLHALTFNVLTTIDGAALKEEDGTIVFPRLSFYEQDGSSPVGHVGGTYMHECMPSEDHEWFDLAKR